MRHEKGSSWGYRCCFSFFFLFSSLSLRTLRTWVNMTQSALREENMGNVMKENRWSIFHRDKRQWTKRNEVYYVPSFFYLTQSFLAQHDKLSHEMKERKPKFMTISLQKILKQIYFVNKHHCGLYSFLS